MSNKWKVVHKGMNKYYYEDEKGNKSPIYKYAEEYSDGFGLIKKDNGHIAYRDGEGHFSEEYDDGDSYSDGYACVRNGTKYAYRDTKGNLSEWFYYAKRYSKGFGLIVRDIDRYAFRDKEGKVSEEEFAFANDYRDDGYAVVKLKNGTWVFRDIHGNILNGKMVDYLKGEISETELSDEEYGDEKFLDMILKRVKNTTVQSVELAENNEQLQSCRDYYLDTMEYVLSNAYDAKVQREALEREKAESFERQKKELLQELNLVD